MELKIGKSLEIISDHSFGEEPNSGYNRGVIDGTVKTLSAIKKENSNIKFVLED